MERKNYTKNNGKNLAKAVRNVPQIFKSYFSGQFEEAKTGAQELIENLKPVSGYDIYGPHLEVLEACLGSKEVSEREFFARVYELSQVLGAKVPDNVKGNYVDREIVEVYPGYGDTSMTIKRRSSDNKL